MGQDDLPEGLPRDYSQIPDKYTQQFKKNPDSGRYEDQFGFDENGFDNYGRNKFGESKKDVIKRRTGRRKRPKFSKLEEKVEEGHNQKETKRLEQEQDKQLSDWFQEQDPSRPPSGFFESSDDAVVAYEQTIDDDAKTPLAIPKKRRKRIGRPFVEKREDESDIGAQFREAKKLMDVEGKTSIPSKKDYSSSFDEDLATVSDSVIEQAEELPGFGDPGYEYHPDEIDLMQDSTGTPREGVNVETPQGPSNIYEDGGTGIDDWDPGDGAWGNNPQIILQNNDGSFDVTDPYGASLDEVHVPGKKSEDDITINKAEIIDSKRYKKDQVVDDDYQTANPDSDTNITLHASPPSGELAKVPSKSSLENTITEKGGPNYQAPPKVKIGVSGVAKKLKLILEQYDAQHLMDQEGEKVSSYDLMGELEAVLEQFQLSNQVINEGKRIGNYVMVSELKSGGMGVVWLANHHNTNRRRAVKMIKNNEGIDEETIEKFQTEASVMEDLDHPNIVNIYDSGDHYGLLYIVMEFIEGGDVEGRVDNEFIKWAQSANYQGDQHKARQVWMQEVARKDKRYKPEPGSWNTREIVRIIRDAGLGIAHGHEKGLVHLDLKPGNIMLKNGHEVKVTDWGLANLVDKVNNPDDGIAGTLNYMPPEQTKKKIIGNKEINGELIEVTDTITEQSDIYSLGAVLYELTTGARQHQTSVTWGSKLVALAQIVEDRIMPPEQVNPELDLDLCAIIKKAMKPNKEERYDTMMGMVEDLNNYLEGRPVNARTYTEVQKLGHHLKRRKFHYAGGFAAGILLWAVSGIIGRRMELSNLENETIAQYESAHEEFRSRQSGDADNLTDVQQELNDALNQIELLLQRDKDNEEALGAKQVIMGNLKRIEYEQKTAQLTSFEQFYNRASQWVRRTGSNFETPAQAYDNQLTRVNEKIGQLRQVREQSKDNEEVVATIDEIISDCESLTQRITELKTERQRFVKRQQQQEQRMRSQTQAHESYARVLTAFTETEQQYKSIPEWFNQKDRAVRGVQEFENSLPVLLQELQQTKSKIENWLKLDENNADALAKLSRVGAVINEINNYTARVQKRQQAYQELAEYSEELQDKDFGAARDSLAAAIQLHFEESMTGPNTQIKTRYDEIIRKQSNWANYQLDLVAQQWSNQVFTNLHRYKKDTADEAQRLREFKQTLGYQRFVDQLKLRLRNPGQREFIDSRDLQSRQYSSADYTAFRHLGIDEDSESFQSLISRFNARAEQEIIDTVRAAVDSTHFTQAVDLNRRISERTPLFGGLQRIWFSEGRGGLSIQQYQNYNEMIRKYQPLPQRIQTRINIWNVHRLKQAGDITEDDYGRYRALITRGQQMPDALRDKINEYYANLDE